MPAMSVRPALPFLLGAALLLGGEALAKKPGEFSAPQQMTEEELAAAKARSKSKVNEWDKDAPKESPPIPWMLIGLAGISFLVAAPFALRAFKSTSRELTGADSSLGSRD
jgi:hypothetical protein